MKKKKKPLKFELEIPEIKAVEIIKPEVEEKEEAVEEIPSILNMLYEEKMRRA